MLPAVIPRHERLEIDQIYGTKREEEIQDCSLRVRVRVARRARVEEDQPYKRRALSVEIQKKVNTIDLEKKIKVSNSTSPFFGSFYGLVFKTMIPCLINGNNKVTRLKHNKNLILRSK
jgi:hypothetical protein